MSNNQQQQSPSGSGSDGGKQRKQTKTRTEARSKFSSPRGKPDLAVDPDFLGYSNPERVNVELTMSESFPTRVGEEYVEQEVQYQRQKGYVNNDDRLSSLAMPLLCVLKQMWNTLPASSLDDAKHLTFLKEEMFVPANLYAIISNFGKFDYNEFVVRYRYDTQDMYQLTLYICKLMSQHVDFNNFVGLDLPRWEEADGGEADWERVAWADVEPYKIVMPIAASTRWIKDQSTAYLERAYNTNFEINAVRGPANEIYRRTVRMPRFASGGTRREKVQAIAAWLLLLEVDIPNVIQAISAAWMTIWDTRWTEEWDQPMSRLTGVAIPAWADWRPVELLAAFEIRIWTMTALVNDADSQPRMIRRVIQNNLSMKVHFDEYVKLVAMPYSEFGTAAQFFVVDPKWLEDTRARGVDLNYVSVGQDVESGNFFKIDDPGLATVGLATAMVRKMDVHPNFVGRLKSNPQAVLKRALVGDFFRIKK